ncbi:MAG: transposase [Anaerolineales bacterium]|nr:transposase [Anaerolineales bacterium]
MPEDIVVVTPSADLGETIRRTLEETGLYRIHVVNNKSSAVVHAAKIESPHAMLDFALGEDWVNEIGYALRTIHPGIKIMVLFDDKATPAPINNLRPWILVRKPFRMSNFMTAINPPQPALSPEVSTASGMPWLSDVNKAAQHLARLTLESSAQAALITLKNDLWAYSGGLSQNAAKEVAQTVSRNWDGQKGSDLLRFIRLESTKAEHMLYATRLTAETVLAFVFDAETPFSTIRAKASQLVNDFGSEPVESQQAPEPIQQLKPVAQQSAPIQQPELDIPIDLDEGDSLIIASISNILTDIPSPNPEPASIRDLGLRGQEEKVDPDQTRVSLPLSNAAVFNRAEPPVVQLDDLVITDQPPVPVAADQPPEPALSADSQTSFDGVDVTAPSRPTERPETPVAKPAPGDMNATRETPTTEAARKLVVEPTSAGLYHLTYACLLVPRFSAHYITGDLAENLSEWLPNICIAFGWRLEFLAVRPEYLQWVVNVQPNTSPGDLMRVMREQTSEKIFGEFNRLKKENPSGDFWALGYLIMGGTQPHPPQLVRDYILQTRQRQGQDSTPIPAR